MKHLKYSLAALALAALAGCASNPTADIRAHSAPDAEFSRYATFGFPEQTGTDRGGYSTLVTSYFKAAVRDQMEQRGYHYVDENPDLLVNFYAKVHERSETRATPTFSAAYGYYGYRYGLYNAWPLYDNDIRTGIRRISRFRRDLQLKARIRKAYATHAVEVVTMVRVAEPTAYSLDDGST